jgi:hypothetical protein
MVFHVKDIGQSLTELVTIQIEPRQRAPPGKPCAAGTSCPATTIIGYQVVGLSHKHTEDEKNRPTQTSLEFAPQIRRKATGL